MEQYYLAIDIGASSGRHILGHMEDGKMVLEEIYRFPNGMTEENGQRCWNVKENRHPEADFQHHLSVDGGKIQQSRNSRTRRDHADDPGVF